MDFMAVCRSRAGTIRHVSVSARLGAQLWAASVDWLASPVTRLTAGGRPDQADTWHRLREPRARLVRARVSDPGGRAGSICLSRGSDR